MLLRETVVILYWFGLYTLVQRLTDILANKMKWTEEQRLVYLLFFAIVTGYILQIYFSEYTFMQSLKNILNKY
jgi:hypothetical protein